MFIGAVPGSVVATKGSCVVGLVWPDKIRASEEVWSDCYKGLRSGAGGAVQQGIRGSGGFGGELCVYKRISVM